jgi:hypothetical protein
LGIAIRNTKGVKGVGIEGIFVGYLHLFPSTYYIFGISICILAELFGVSDRNREMHFQALESSILDYRSAQSTIFSALLKLFLIFFYYIIF